MYGDYKPLELWQRALLARLAERRARYQASARARLVLVAMLTRAGYPVSLTRVHVWSRAMQGQAYLWAHAFLWGLEDVPPPDFVVESAVPALAKAWMPAPAKRKQS